MIDFALIFLTGFLTGFHCIAMCGSLVFSYGISDKNAGAAHHVAYNAARIISYTITGAFLGFVGSVFSFSPSLRAGASILAGLFMAAIALNMLGFKWFRFLSFAPPKILVKKFSESSGETGVGKPFFIGLLNGFMPCGPLQAMQLYAAGTGSAFEGALVMLTYGIGTTPLLLGFGILITKLGAGWRQKIFRIAAVAVMLLALMMLDRGLLLLGSAYAPSNLLAGITKTQTLSPTPEGASIPSGTQEAVEIQETSLIIDAYRYVPDTLVVEKGKPVRLTVLMNELSGCNQELVFPNFGINLVFSKTGESKTVEFTPREAGVYSFTCGMGMMRGTLIVR